MSDKNKNIVVRGAQIRELADNLMMLSMAGMPMAMMIASAGSDRNNFNEKTRKALNDASAKFTKGLERVAMAAALVMETATVKEKAEQDFAETEVPDALPDDVE